MKQPNRTRRHDDAPPAVWVPALVTVILTVAYVAMVGVLPFGP